MDTDTMMEELEQYNLATKTLNMWIAGAQAIALLRASLSCGIFDAVREPATVEHIAQETRIDKHIVYDVCEALFAHDVVEKFGDTFVLTEAFATISAPHVAQSLSNILNMEEVVLRTLHQCVDREKVYTALPSEDMLAIAIGQAPLPTSSSFLAQLADFADSMPEVKQIWEAGGKHIELGSGAGGWLIGLLLLFPKLYGVGIEMNSSVRDESLRRAKDADIWERVDLRHGDACALTEEAEFDTAFWSQPFFPVASRSRLLATAYRVLKPGGYLFMPVVSEPPSRNAYRTTFGRSYTINRLVYRSWSVPMLNISELEDEAREAGFEPVRAVLSARSPFLLIRRPCK